MSDDFDPARWSLERYDAISTRILDSDASVAAMIEQLSNGRWIVTIRDKAVCGASFDTIPLAFAWWQAAAQRLLCDSDRNPQGENGEAG